MTDTPNIAIAPRSLSFTDEAEFSACLDTLKRNVVVYPTQRPDEILIDPHTCRTRNNHTYTTSALSQTCAAICPGLWSAIASMAGLNLEDTDDDDIPDDTSIVDAVEMFNRFAKRRFSSRLYGRNLVRTSPDIIDGLVGPKYQLMPNLDLFNSATKAIRESDHDIKFADAWIHGRRMSFRYLKPDAIFEVKHAEHEIAEPFFGGVHCENSEIGDRAVVVGVAIIRQWCDNRAIGVHTSKDRVTHSGRQFYGKVQSLLGGMSRRLLETGKLKESVLRLMHTPLGLGKSDEEDTERMQAIVKKLNQHGIGHTVAQKALNRAITDGSFGVKRGGDAHRLLSDTAVLAKRNVYDLFNGLTEEAKSRSLVQRDTIEKVSYSLLVGGFSLN